MSAVLYTRLPEPLKQALAAHAAARALSLSGAVAELLEQALAASSAQPTRAELEAQLAQLRNALTAAEARADAAEFALQAARERERLFARSCQAFAERAGHPLATCQRCKGALRGTDLLISGRCPNPTCSAPALTSLLLPAPRAGLDQHEYLALLGALGALVQLALPDPSDG